ncbi:unnamed protein product [marine sediment metagenome]|uniref:Uncharacterized protein n=1 Tax=marine sediment metagenome TaxID=412755 RepID=X1SIS8_9ZZZZ
MNYIFLSYAGPNSKIASSLSNEINNRLNTQDFYDLLSENINLFSDMLKEANTEYSIYLSER